MKFLSAWSFWALVCGQFILLLLSLIGWLGNGRKRGVLRKLGTLSFLLIPVQWFVHGWLASVFTLVGGVFILMPTAKFVAIRILKRAGVLLPWEIDELVYREVRRRP